jgi:large subunit ribosomal protein L29
MKAQDVHKMTLQEMVEHEANLRRKLFELRSQAVTENLDNPRQLQGLRRDVARILTERTARQRAAAAQSQTAPRTKA